jgi:hypothetical protein
VNLDAPVRRDVLTDPLAKVEGVRLLYCIRVAAMFLTRRK